ncbi:MAG: ABC transporter ATP-binding protein [Thermodesulfobacteriota bacterium]
MIEAKAISQFYGHKAVFRKLALSAYAGEVHLVLGPNGAGKSTLLKVLSGLLAPTHGTVQRRVQPGEIGYMGHETFIYPRLSAVENLLFWARLYGKAVQRKQILEILTHLDLHAVAQEEAGHFSRGMAQRLSLGRLLVLQPKLVFLDEPSTGLDASSQGLLGQEILRMRARGACVFWVSHDPDRDLPQADAVIALRAGQGRQYASTHAYTQATGAAGA